MEAQRKKRTDAAKAIEKKMETEHMKRQWWFIQRTVKDPPTPPLLKVTRMEEKREVAYEGQEEVEGALQDVLEALFTFAHNAPIMNHYLGHQLRYLSDELQRRAYHLNTGQYVFRLC